MIQLAIFASGAGSNAQNIIDFYKNSQQIRIAAIYTNRANAGVIEIAREHQIPLFLLSKSESRDGSFLLNHLRSQSIDFVVLAGYLALVPPEVIQAFPQRIINIHPSLLPKYGGKGMYGMHVHEAVVKQGEKESGITIHLIDEEYDRGEILLQKKCSVGSEDTPEAVAHKVHELEYAYFPSVIDLWVRKSQDPACDVQYAHL